MEKRKLTLCFPRRYDGAVLLGLKRRGFGAGKWNGFGGKCKDTETALHTTVRELKEETGLQIFEPALTKSASLTFVYVKENRTHEVIVYTYQISSDYEPMLTDEMKPHWFRTNEIPYEEMWIGDQYWLPHVLRGEYLEGYFIFKDFETLREYSVHVGEKNIEQRSAHHNDMQSLN